jgi:type I restriction-modification system DNA methylase subunit
VAKKTAKADTGANIGLEGKLWQTADALRNNMDAAEYKHVVLGLIFLKYISDAFEARHTNLASQRQDGADPEDPDEYRARAPITRGAATRMQERTRMSPVSVRLRPLKRFVSMDRC